MIYLIQHGNTNYVKIGYSNNEAGVIKRLRACQTGNPIQLSLLGTIDGTQSGEKYIQSAFASKRIKGEWFDLTPKDIEQILNTKDVIKLARRLIKKILGTRGNYEFIDTVDEVCAKHISEEESQNIIDKLSVYYPNKKEQTAAIEKVRFERLYKRGPR